MANNQFNYTAIGGSDILVMLEFPTIIINGKPGILVMASAITVSYSVYRAKTPVYNLGQPIMSGMSIGKKTVAGSLVTVSYQVDEISNFIDMYLSSQSNLQNGTSNLNNSNGLVSSNTSVNVNGTGSASYKEMHTVMRDDLTPFNIHFLMSDEYTGQAGARRLVVYGANFINNGQVMSINDIITENTLSFIGLDVREQHPINAPTSSINTGQTALLTATSLLSQVNSNSTTNNNPNINSNGNTNSATNNNSNIST